MGFTSFHKQVAVEGLGGGHKVFSVLGLKWFSIDVEIIPQNTGGGTAGPSILYPDPPQQLIKVTVRFKGKEWVSVKEVNKLTRSGLEIINVVFVGYKKLKADVFARFNSAKSFVESIKIRINRK